MTKTWVDNKEYHYAVMSLARTMHYGMDITWEEALESARRFASQQEGSLLQVIAMIEKETFRYEDM